jgi:hypothetical protein
VSGALSIAGIQTVSIAGGGNATVTGAVSLATGVSVMNAQLSVAGIVSIGGGFLSVAGGVVSIANSSFSIAGIVTVAADIASIAGGVVSVAGGAVSVAGFSALSTARGSVLLVQTNMTEHISLSGVYSATTGQVTVMGKQWQQATTTISTVPLVFATFENPAGSPVNLFVKAITGQSHVLDFSTNVSPQYTGANPQAAFNQMFQIARITGTLGTTGGTTLSGAGQIVKHKSSYASPIAQIRVFFPSIGSTNAVGSTLAGVSPVGAFSGSWFPLTTMSVNSGCQPPQPAWGWSVQPDALDDIILLPGEGLALLVYNAPYINAGAPGAYDVGWIANFRWREGTGG